MQFNWGCRFRRHIVLSVHLYFDLDVTTASSPLLYSDSTSALSLTDESAPYPKYIDTRYHYIRDTLEQYEIHVDYVPSEENPADVFSRFTSSLCPRYGSQIGLWSVKDMSNVRITAKRGFLVSMLVYRESHITLRSIYKRFFPFSILSRWYGELASIKFYFNVVSVVSVELCVH